MRLKFSACCTFAFLLQVAQGATVLFDFETEAERAAVKAVSGKGWRVAVSDRFATSGEHGLLFKCAPGEWSAKDGKSWPSFSLSTDVGDWSEYDRLVVDVVNVGEGDDIVDLFVGGDKGDMLHCLYAWNGHQSRFRLPRNGYKQWIFPLKWQPSVSRSSVSRIFVNAVKSNGFSMTIDRVALLKKDEKPPVPDGPHVGRDLLPLMQSEFSKLGVKARDLESQRRHAQDYMRFRESCNSAGVQSRDFLLGWATSMEKILPRGPFSARPLTQDGLGVRLARNEYESVQLLVAPKGMDLKGVRVRLDGDLRRTGGGPHFAASNVACDVTAYVKTYFPPIRPQWKVTEMQYRSGFNVPTNCAPGYARMTEKPYVGWWPDPILGFLDGIEIADDDVQSFWIRVRCPQDQAAGTYRGTLVVSAQDAETVRVPFAIRVNDFDVGRTPMLPVVVTFEPFGPGKTNEAPSKLWRRHEREWVDFLADYLISYDSLYHKCDTGRLSALSRLKQEGRLGPYNLGYWRIPKSASENEVEKSLAAYIDGIKGFYAEAKKLGIEDKAYVFVCDEFPAHRFHEVKKAVDAIKAALPGVPVITTAYDGNYGVGTILEKVDWFCPYTATYDARRAEAARNAGHQVWWYICNWPTAPFANMFVECQAIEGRVLMGAQSVKMRPDGFLYYQISSWDSFKCIEDGPFTSWYPMGCYPFNGDGTWTCTGPDGTPVPTIRLENFRDGLEDYAYAKILEAKLAVHADKDDNWAQTAKKLIAVPRKVTDTMSNYTDDPEVLYRWRNAMADLIEKGSR